MAALLPHNTLEMRDDYEVYADNVLCNDLAGRQTVLQAHSQDSICVQFDDIKNLKKTDLRNIFTGKQVVYVYHNQIDARGDKANTEDEVFVACEEAVKEIMADRNQAASLENLAFQNKFLDHFFSKAKVTEKAVTVAELFNQDVPV